MILDEMKLIYLAAPYSANDHKIESMRFAKTCNVQAKLMANGIAVFSPLANSIPAVKLGGLQLEHTDFMRYDCIILRRCDELLVLALNGWRESNGVQLEMEEAITLRKPVLIIDEKDIDDLPFVKEKCNVFGRSKILSYRK